MKGEFFSGTGGLQIDVPKRDFVPDYSHLSRLGYYSLKKAVITYEKNIFFSPQDVSRFMNAVRLPKSQQGVLVSSVPTQACR
jgi:hypothetical protein